jgi:hypothetical protein
MKRNTNAEAPAAPDIDLDAGDLKQLDKLTADYARSKKELASYPAIQAEAQKDLQYLKVELEKLGPKHIAEMSGEGEQGEHARTLLSQRRTVEDKLRLIPECRARHQKVLDDINGALRGVILRIRDRQLPASRERMLQDTVELRRVLYDIYGKQAAKVIAVSDVLISPPMHVRMFLPKVDAVEWYEFWSEFNPPYNCDLLQEVGTLKTMLERFKSRLPLRGNPSANVPALGAEEIA